MPRIKIPCSIAPFGPLVVSHYQLVHVALPPTKRSCLLGVLSSPVGFTLRISNYEYLVRNHSTCVLGVNGRCSSTNFLATTLHAHSRVQVFIHQRNGDRSFLQADALADHVSASLEQLANVSVATTDTGTLAEQASHFLGADVAIMSHGAALGFYQYMPADSCWVDVTYGDWLRPRRFIR